MDEGNDAPSSDDGRREYEYPDGQPPTTTRRNVAKLLAAISGTAASGGCAVDYLTGLSAAGHQSGGKKLTYKDIYTKGVKLVDKKGNALKASSALPAGSGKEMDAFPEKKGGGALMVKDATTLLLRFDESKYQKPTNTAGTTKGYVAYSKVCTHEGCLVSGRQGEDLHCPCHNTIYDPKKGAKVVSGPAPRALPQLPIGISKSDELLIATGPFTGPIGPSE